MADSQFQCLNSIINIIYNLQTLNKDLKDIEFWHCWYIDFLS